MTFDEVLSVLKTNRNPNEEFIGLFFQPEKEYFGFYKVYVDPDDLDWIGVFFEGGFLFSDGGEEDCYSLDDVPEEAKNLFYKNSKDLPEISGLISEFALFTLFPFLPDPDDLWSDAERADFIKATKDHFCSLLDLADSKGLLT